MFVEQKKGKKKEKLCVYFMTRENLHSGAKGVSSSEEDSFSKLDHHNHLHHLYYHHPMKNKERAVQMAILGEMTH